MDLNTLFARHQTALMRIASAVYVETRMAHGNVAREHAGRIDVEQRASKATFPLGGLFGTRERRA